MNPGQFLVNKDGLKREIKDVTEKSIAFKLGDDYDLTWFLISDLKKVGWSLLEEPWVPTGGSNYFYIAADGQKWHKEFGDDQIDRFNLLIGNYARTEAEAELYRQKLIERMGRKEN